MSAIPKFAQDLAIEACIYLESQGHKVEIPLIKWRKPKVKTFDCDSRLIRTPDDWRKHRTSKARKTSSGVCYRTHITISAGSDRTDCRMVLLHELAHWALPWKEHHSDAFWTTAFDLYRHFKLPIRYCLNREKGYRKNAIVGYRNNRGAK